MTLPANFPARIVARRVRAIERLEALNANRGKCQDGSLSKLSYAERVALADSIALKLNGVARDIRTKKHRGARR